MISGKSIPSRGSWAVWDRNEEWVDMQKMNEISAADLRDLAADAFEVVPAEVTDDADFYQDLGIDSLQKIEFVVRIERRTGVRLTDEEAANLNTLADALTVLRARGVSIAA
ncbi:acyl carrier protein [Plantactinospora sp. GCM10030261]|uniref:acyl carrier protein n=1 Tax=Plantactinospora sp. GCM10030261 TaxID=3273420 RepID=UPI00360BFFBA